MGRLALVVLFCELADGDLVSPPRGSSDAFEEVKPIVVLVTQGKNFPAVAWDEAEQRTQVEFNAVGLFTLTVDGGGASDAERDEELETTTRSAQAMGAARIRRTAFAAVIDMWLPEPDRATRVHRTLQFEGPLSTHGARVVALRVAEVFRSRLVEIQGGRADENATEPAPRPAPTTPPVPRASNRLAVHARAVAIALPHQAVGFGALLGGRWRVLDSLHLGVDVVRTLTDNRLAISDASSRLSLTFGRLEARFMPWHRATWGPSFGVGVGALLAEAEGRPTSAWIGRAEHAWSALGTTTVALGWRPRPHLELSAGIGAAFALPPITLRFATERVATIGRPLLDASVGAGFLF